MPAAIVGSIALTFIAAPAHASEPAQSHRLSPHAAAPDSTSSLRISPAATTSAKTAQVPPTYTVQRGDTISAIAGRFGLRIVDVLTANGLGWSSVIRPGQVLRLTAAPAAAPANQTPPTTAGAGAYVVKAGDTIIAIARAHSTSVQAILDANRLNRASIIYPGQKLAIPGAAAMTPAASTTPVAAAPTSPSPSPYVVKVGDTISAIARTHGTSVQAILDANRLNRSSIIYPGQKLALPAAMAPAASTTLAPGLDAEQSANARLIVRIGRQLGVSDRGITIALGTAMQESWLRNLDWGDRDSLGLFQQRPSHGWGTAAEVRNAERAVRAFYGGASDPNGARTRGLLDIVGWQAMSYAQAAQAVQISAYPDRYAQWEAPSAQWLATLG